MTAGQWSRIKEILCDALDEEQPERRAQLLKARCAGDEELLAEVERLLRGHENAGRDFLRTLAAPQPPPGAEPESVPAELVAGRYLVQRLLGQGGVSLVFLAHDLEMAMRPVVLKVLNAKAASNEWICSKFRHEMEALARIRHPGVVQALDFRPTESGQFVLVLEYLEGRTLREEILPGGLPLGQAQGWVEQLGGALAAAHRQGVQHRDVKPENVILRAQAPEGGGGFTATLIDFGIAKVESPEHAMLTDTVVLAGTTSYMAPEQLLGRATPAADQYALAVVAFEMLTGKRPYYPATPVQLFDMQKREAPPDPRTLRADLPPSITPVLRRALAFRPEERYPSINEFTADLLAALGGGRTSLDRTSRRKWLLAGTAAPLIFIASTQRERIEDMIDARTEISKVVAWNGTEDPEKLGFELQHDLRTRWEETPDRAGYRGMRLFSGSQGVYLRHLSRAQKKAAAGRGWRLSLEALAIQGSAAISLDLTPIGKRFDMVVTAPPGGGQSCILPAGLKPRLTGPEFSLPSGRHAYQLESRPHSFEASLSIDGKLTAHGYRGHADYQEDKNVLFGVLRYLSESAEGVIYSVRFEIL